MGPCLGVLGLMFFLCVPPLLLECIGDETYWLRYCSEEDFLRSLMFLQIISHSCSKRPVNSQITKPDFAGSPSFVTDVLSRMNRS